DRNVTGVQTCALPIYQPDVGSNAEDSCSACSPLGINYTCVITAPSSPHGVLGWTTFDYSNTPSHAHAPGTPHIGRVTEIGHNLRGGPEQMRRISERVAVEGVIEEWESNHRRPTMNDRLLTVYAPPVEEEVAAGSDLDAILINALRRNRIDLKDGDVLVVASKVVSKAEGRLTTVADRTEFEDLVAATGTHL